MRTNSQKKKKNLKNLQKRNLNNYKTPVLFASFNASFSVIFTSFSIVYLSGRNDCATTSALAKIFGSKPISFAVVGAPEFFKVLTIFDNGYLLIQPKGFPSIRSSQLIKVKLDKGISETFFMKGIDEVMEQSKSICESGWQYEHVEPKTKEMNV